ncbi:putative phospholipase B-like 2 [Gigantopelta aegis]|uniref:putative phospholipase B-like 2 n=1 Tax=Gigantopelta aegis TaxID=1735272 RepID=UPI001B887A8D|nr:putative phospholipase B-like 2 [Gigantopelta aegis]
METTIPVYNDHLWKFVKPRGIVMEPVRAWTANRLADNGQQWVQTFARYNSGTYNNEWMVIDYKLFQPGSKELKPGLLTIIEQLPGYVTYADVTDVLQKQGYWASYNLPYFPDVYNMSGLPAKFDNFGDHFSHDNCPRAKIIKRDQSKITGRKSLYEFMRYNDYLNDPLSKCKFCTPAQNADYAISARNDLNPHNGTYPIQILEHMMFGATDVKMTSHAAINWLQMEAVSGPTYDPLPPFQWSKHDNKRHFGHPDLFHFKPIYFNGTNLPPYPVE